MYAFAKKMCGRYQLTTDFAELPLSIRKDLPRGFKENYEKQYLLKPKDPVLVLKNEGKVQSSLMLWGLIPEWSQSPLNGPMPFNARAETIKEKAMFRNSWRHKRCLLPANAFYEKGHIVRRKDYRSFWLAALWERWMSPDGSELESCCVITTRANALIRPLHNRMPVIIPNEFENKWLSIQDSQGLKSLELLLTDHGSDGWITETLTKGSKISQMNLF